VVHQSIVNLFRLVTSAHDVAYKRAKRRTERTGKKKRAKEEELVVLGWVGRKKKRREEQGIGVALVLRDHRLPDPARSRLMVDHEVPASEKNLRCAAPRTTTTATTATATH